MKTLLEAIQQYPEQFISTCRARANTTPSSENRVNHQLMAISIEHEEWEIVISLLQDSQYRKPLEGVVFCLDTYSEIDKEVWFKIVELFENGDIV